MTSNKFFGLPPEIQEKIIVFLSFEDILAFCHSSLYLRITFLKIKPIVKNLIDLIDQKEQFDEAFYTLMEDNNLIRQPIRGKLVLLILHKLVQDEMNVLSQYNERCSYPEIVQHFCEYRVGFGPDYTQQIKMACQNINRVLLLRSLHEMDRVASNSVRFSNKLVFGVFISLLMLLVVSSYPLFLMALIATIKVISSNALLIVLFSVAISSVYCGVFGLFQIGYDKFFDQRKQHNALIASYYHKAGDLNVHINSLSRETKHAGFFSYEQASKRALNRMHHSLRLIKP